MKTFLLFISLSFFCYSQDFDLLLKGRGVQAIEKLDSLKKLPSTPKNKIEIGIETAYSNFVNPELSKLVIQKLENVTFYHIIINSVFLCPEGYAGSLDVVYSVTNKTGELGAVRVDKIPTGTTVFVDLKPPVGDFSNSFMISNLKNKNWPSIIFTKTNPINITVVGD